MILAASLTPNVPPTSVGLTGQAPVLRQKNLSNVKKGKEVAGEVVSKRILPAEKRRSTEIAVSGKKFVATGVWLSLKFAMLLPKFLPASMVFLNALMAAVSKKEVNVLTVVSLLA